MRSSGRFLHSIVSPRLALVHRDFARTLPRQSEFVSARDCHESFARTSALFNECHVFYNVSGVNANNDSWKLDKDLVLAAVSRNGLALGHVANFFKEDRDVVSAAVSQNGLALKHAANRLKADKCVVLAAVSENGHALRYADDYVKAFKEVVLTAIANTNGAALKHASDCLKADKNVVLLAVSLDGETLRHADVNLKADKDVVLTAVANTGKALKFAFEGFKADKDIVLAAVRGAEPCWDETGLNCTSICEDGYGEEMWIHVLMDADEAMTKDKEIILTCLNAGHFGLSKVACPILRADQDVAMASFM